MKSKIFTISAIANKDGQERVVTVVGELTKEKVSYVDEFEMEVNDKKGKTLQGVGTVERKIPIRHFTMAYSICHPEDKFDKEVGIKLATARLKKKPIGTLSSFNRTMFNDEQCNMLLFTEVMHITKNIDKFIDMI